MNNLLMELENRASKVWERDDKEARITWMEFCNLDVKDYQDEWSNLDSQVKSILAVEYNDECNAKCYEPRDSSEEIDLDL